MFGEGRWWFCRTCSFKLALYANQDLDLHSIILALGDRALKSDWVGYGVDCYGTSAEQLCSLTDRELPIAGNDLLHITAGVRQTIEGDFKAFDREATSHWFYLRAWDGSGFYVEINDYEIKNLLQNRFRYVEEIEEAKPPYAGLFIPCND